MFQVNTHLTKIWLKSVMVHYTLCGHLYGIIKRQYRRTFNSVKTTIPASSTFLPSWSFGWSAAVAILSRWHLKIFSSLITPTGSLSRNSAATTFRSLNIHYIRVPVLLVVAAAVAQKQRKKLLTRRVRVLKKLSKVFFTDGRQTEKLAKPLQHCTFEVSAPL